MSVCSQEIIDYIFFIFGPKIKLHSFKHDLDGILYIRMRLTVRNTMYHLCLNVFTQRRYRQISNQVWYCIYLPPPPYHVGVIQSSSVFFENQFYDFFAVACALQICGTTLISQSTIFRKLTLDILKKGEILLPCDQWFCSNGCVYLSNRTVNAISSDVFALWFPCDK